MAFKPSGSGRPHRDLLGNGTLMGNGGNEQGDRDGGGGDRRPDQAPPVA
jgi:hypothetical protein